MSNTFVEFHILRSFAPSNLNRDDMGSPKSAIFGGVRRLRISSQCLKRTMRLSESFTGTFAEEKLGIRTKLVGREIVQAARAKGESSEAFVAGLGVLLASLGKKAKAETSDLSSDDDVDTKDAAESDATMETGHLLYLGRHEINALVEFAIGARADLEKLGSAKKPNAKSLEAMRDKMQEALKEATDARNPVDIALFGRFLTSAEFAHVDASLQVAHALGTQKVELETDYFTAMDDLGSEPGAGMLGETEFASSVLYCYAVCDLELLKANLKQDSDLAFDAVGAIAEGLARSVPTGKKNGTAPHSPADYVNVTIRKDAPVSLANAFLKPIAPTDKLDVMEGSIDHLQKQKELYAKAYGVEGITASYTLNLRSAEKAMPTGENRVDSIAELRKQVSSQLRKMAKA
jgi:CRISPR system Cascade subunit CasC